MSKNKVVVAAMSVMMIALGCMSEPGIDKAKFAEMNKIARELQASIPTDKPCDVSDALLQKLASGTEALKGKASSRIESGVITEYANLVTTYRDGMLLCQSLSQMSRFPFVPKGRIYVFQELDPIVEKYELPTERHVYKPTGVHWKSIDADSMRVVWERAGNQIKDIETTVNYN